MIRQATPEDIDGVEEGYEELMAYEKEHGAYTTWKPGVYPTRETARQSLTEGTLHVMEQDGRICASIILNRDQPEEYGGIKWKYGAKPGEVLLIHTLCVRPSKAGSGIGKKMVLYAFEQARQMNCKVIRLDTGAQNKPAVALYTKLGFELAGSTSILLSGLIPHQGHLFFELKI